MKGSMSHVKFMLAVMLVSTTSSESVVDNIHFVGCYDPGYSLRQNYHHHIAQVTLAKCVEYCKIMRTRFAGIEASDHFCYCGGDIGEESIQRNDSLCNVPCPEESLRTCGGDWLMSLYDIGRVIPDDTTDSVDFLIGVSTGVRLYHTNESYFDTLMTTTDWAHGVDYHFSKNLIFVYSKNRIYKATLDSKRSPVLSNSTLIKDTSYCNAFAVDWVLDRVYYANCHNLTWTAIMAMGLDGGAPSIAVSRPELAGRAISRMEVDPYKGMLFWLTEGMLQSYEFSSNELSVNISDDLVTVRALALDLQQRRIFYVGIYNQSYTLFSMDYQGDSKVEHFSIPQLKSVYGLGLLGNQVYWVNYANVRDVIYTTTLNYSNSEDVVLLKTIDRAVWHMKVVHPSLQRRPNIDPCLDKSCAYRCVTRRQSARCVCPADQQLHADGVSCNVPWHQGSSQTPAGAVLVGFLMVIAVVMASLALVYFGDMYWSLLQSKLFGVPYSRSSDSDRVGCRVGEDLATVSPEQNSSEDNMNLI